ncbi:MAG: hypothetical protein RBS39_12670 [Phycisphaerales bacterium]|jgi:hypothetical protein|nr:hypothetical protein [Phycisphaerales bacterium]
MARSTPHPDARNPLDEGVVLAWIEGELSGPEADAVARAVALDPALRDWAAAVRRDRAAMSTLPEERAPARVMRGVEQALERHVLMAARVAAPERAGDEGPGAIPVSIVLPPRYTLGERVGDVLAHRWFGRGVRFAAAAVLLGAAGVGVWIGSAWLGRGSGPAIASREVDKSSPLLEEPIDASEVGALALAPHAGLADALDGALIEKAEGEGASDALAATGTFGPTIEPELTLARAAELARTGRLVVRVRTGDPMQGVDATAAITERLVRMRGVHALDREVSLAMGEALAGPGTATMFDFAMADDAGATALREQRAAGRDASRNEPDARQVAAVLVGEVDADERELERLLRVLRQRGSVTLEPAPTNVSAGPALDAESLLWWSEPPAHWSPRGRVLIVVESR